MTCWMGRRYWPMALALAFMHASRFFEPIVVVERAIWISILIWTRS